MNGERQAGGGKPKRETTKGRRGRPPKDFRALPPEELERRTRDWEGRLERRLQRELFRDRRSGQGSRLAPGCPDDFKRLRKGLKTGRHVLLRITGEQIGPDKEHNELATVSSPGRYRQYNGQHIFIYKEPGNGSFLDGSLCRVTYDERQQRASLKRLGENDLAILFYPKLQQFSVYNTPYGPVRLGFYTHKVEFERHENGGRLYLDYDVDQGPKLRLTNHVTIEFSYVKRGIYTHLDSPESDAAVDRETP